MYKKIISFVVIVFLVTPYSLYNVFAEIPNLTCNEYKSDFESCAWENETWNGWARSIDSYVCIDENWSWTEILAQIILDKKFSEIDDVILEYIENLEESKEYSPEKLDEVINKFYIYWEYWNQYDDLCKKWIREEMFKCSNSFSWPDLSNFLWWDNNWSCTQLVQVKLKAYREVLYSILKLNKLAVRKSARDWYTEDERTKYDNLIKMTTTINWYLNRILTWWVTKTKNPYNCK